MHAQIFDWGAMHVAKRDSDRPDVGGPDLVFINSLGTDLRMWDAVLARLPSSWSALRMDKRGHGLSSTAPEGYGIPELAQDVIDAMDAAQLGQVVLVGCSIGGLIAQHIALMVPDRVQALVLSSTASKLGPAEGWLDRIDAIKGNGMAPMAEGILPRWFGPDMLENPDAALWRTLLGRTDQEGYVATCRAIAGTDVTDRLPEITQPSLVIAGEHDLATPPAVVEALARALPRANFVMFPTGHLPAIETPDAFSQALIRFVERITT